MAVNDQPLPDKIHPVVFGGFWDFNEDGYYQSQSLLDESGYPNAERVATEMAFRYNMYPKLMEEKQILCLNLKFGIDQELGVQARL